MALLTDTELMKVYEAAASLGFQNRRSTLLAGIDPTLAPALLTPHPSLEQLLSDLRALNQVGRLPDGTVPLVIWLKTAQLLVHGAGPYGVFGQTETRIRAYLATLPRTTESLFTVLFRRLEQVVRRAASRIWTIIDTFISWFVSLFASVVGIVITLDASFDELEHRDLEEVLARLRYEHDDPSLRLRQLAEGSVIVTLEGTKAAYRGIRAAFRSGALSRLFGRRVLGVRLSRTSSSSVQSAPDAPIVFVSYHQGDSYWRDRVVEHLTLLQHQRLIRLWDESLAPPGANLAFEAEDASEGAVAVLLLLSATFLASPEKFNEARLFIEHRTELSPRVYPILVRPCAWRQLPWLASIQPVPPMGRALAELKLAQAERELVLLVSEIADLVRKRDADVTHTNERPHEHTGTS